MLSSAQGREHLVQLSIVSDDVSTHSRIQPPRFVDRQKSSWRKVSYTYAESLPLKIMKF